jgi:hypothetical protein
MDVWRAMAVSPAQREVMAGIWTRWVAQRQATYDRMRALAHGLLALPGKVDAPSDVVVALAREQANADNNCDNDRGVAAARTHMATAEAYSYAVQTAAAANIGGQWDVVRRRPALAPLAWARRFIGVCPHATARAGALLAQLRQAQVDDANAFAAFNCLILCSGEGLRAEQAVRHVAGAPWTYPSEAARHTFCALCAVMWYPGDARPPHRRPAPQRLQHAWSCCRHDRGGAWCALRRPYSVFRGPGLC